MDCLFKKKKAKKGLSGALFFGLLCKPGVAFLSQASGRQLGKTVPNRYPGLG